jgi:formylglycine-generating enzyme
VIDPRHATPFFTMLRVWQAASFGIVLGVLGCHRDRADPPPPVTSAPSAEPSAAAASATPIAPAPVPSAAVGPKTSCPPDMALVPDPGVCIQRWEAELYQADGSLHDPYTVPPPPSLMTGMTVRSAPGTVPQGYLGRDQAEAACRNTVREGFQYRLCTREEWQAGCRGPARRLFPYGTDYRIEGRCNTHKFPDDEHLVKRFYPEPRWSTSEMNDPRINRVPEGLARTGTYRRCTNAYGLFDMVGNLQEWVSTLQANRAGQQLAMAMGDHYMGQGKNYQGCDARDAYHPYYPDHFAKNQRDYSRGIRCCADPR